MTLRPIPKVRICRNRRGAFNQVQQLVAQRYPHIEVIGSTYPIPPLNAALAEAATIARSAVLALALAGDAVLNFLNMRVPQLYVDNVAPNRFGWCIGAWFLGNMLNNQLTGTGAFEIFADEKLVFSKLQTGRLPNLEELWAGMEAALGPPGPAEVVTQLP
jgi:selT/selW/selH-like putative selenoprotein